MKYTKTYNVLEGFDFSLLDDSGFKEDSVREEIIVPIIKELGYSASKPNKIIRSKALVHPYVSIGSATKNISIIPDYLFEVNSKYAWVLEAKAPSEEITNNKHVEQAYSYAIHSEVRVPYFALCNGKEFVLYHISEIEPVLQFNMLELPNWENLRKLLSPNTVLDCDHKLAKDFGLHLKRLGFSEFKNLIFPDVPMIFIAQLSDNNYTFGAGMSYEGGAQYAVSYDFDTNVLQQLSGKIPDQAIEILNQPFDGEIRNVQFSDATFYINVDCRVGDKLEENENEIFLPLVINKIIQEAT